MITSQNQQEKTIQMFYKEKEKGETNLSHRKETIRDLRKNVETYKNEIHEKEMTLKELHSKLNQLYKIKIAKSLIFFRKAEIIENKTLLNQNGVKFQNMKNEFDSLTAKKKEIESRKQAAPAENV